MKILYSGSLASSTGGPAMSAYLSLVGLKRLGADVAMIQYPLKPGDVLRGDEVTVHFASSPLEHKMLYAPKLKKEILALGDFDIYHAQGVWQWPTYALASVARKTGKPYLITPRGMLYPQDIAKSNSWMKKLSLKCRLLSDLNKAACVHVTCMEEMKHCRDLGVTSPIAVIPNPVEIKNYPFVKTDSVRRIGYLGRLSHRKNVESLIYAFHSLGESAKDAELLIIGGGDANYEKFLHEEVDRLGLRNVKFVGFLNGEAKDKALASCSVLAMPSEFENFGNVVVEGLVRSIPCIATTGSPWEELNSHQCGWWIPYSQESITSAVASALSISDEELNKMGDNGRQLVEERYSVEAVAKQLLRLYEWVVGNEERPNFVFVR